MLKRFIAILLSLIFVLSLSACGKDSDNTSSTGSVDSSSKSPIDIFPSASSDTSSSTLVDNPVSNILYSSEESSSEDESDSGTWKMKLVNKWNTISDEEAPKLVEISSKYAWANDKRFDARAIDAITALCEQAHADGVKLYIISAYRTDATQTRLFNNQVNRELANNPSLTREEAEVEAATAVARPGTSEHQLGLAVDFNSVEEDFEQTKEFAWLDKHAHEYGFIMRYPKEKQDKTAVIYEPWHYRYVGVENAKAIKDSGLCLEEFIEQHK